MRKTILLSVPLAFLVTGCANKPTTAFEKPPGADLYVKAMVELDNGNQETAIADLNAAIEQNPSLRMARMKLGELYLTRKDYEQAVPHLEAASDLDPYTVDNHYNLGVALQVLNRLQEAALAYIRGIKLDENSFGCNMNLGLVYFALGQLDPAIYFIERATRLQPNSAPAWSNLGVVYDAAGNAVLAEASYRKAMELDVNSQSTLINLTSNLIGQAKSADAVAIAKQLVAQRDDPMSYKRLGDAYAVGRQWQEAAAAYDSALAKDRRFTQAINAKAQMLVTRYENDLRLDDSLRQNAMTLWNESLKIRPEQPSVKDNLAKWNDSKVFK
jgi:tetratricopeptide (TPR) repeat protein